MTIAQWSTTAANNGSGVTGISWAEGQAPSTVNDSARETMAQIATWLGQASGAIPEFLSGTAGTNTITATGPSQMASYVAGQRFFFIPANTNTGATTLNITPSGASALGAKDIFFRGAACVGGEIVQNVPVTVIYDGTQFNLMVSSLSTAAAGSSLVLLGSKAASASASISLGTTGAGAADIQFDWTAYDAYKFFFHLLRPATDAQALLARYSTDGGSTFISTANYNYAYMGFDSAAAANSSGAVGQTSITVLNSVGNDANYQGLDGEMLFSKPSATGYKKIVGTFAYYDATQLEVKTSMGVYVGATTAINGIQFRFASGNITSGTIYAYGIKKS